MEHEPGEEYVNAYEENGRLVLLRREGDTLRRIVKPAEFSAFYRATEIHPDLRRSLSTSQFIRSVKEEGEFLRVSFKDRNVRQALVRGTNRGGSPLAGITVLEGDVHPVRRFLSDNPVKIQRPKVAYLDLETDSRVPFSRKEEARILSWAVVNPAGEKFRGVLNHDNTQDEKRLLEELFEVLSKYDLVAAWNGDGFDFPVLGARASNAMVRVNMRNWLWLDHLALFKRMNTAGESGDEKSSMKLNDVAQHLLGEGKDEFDASKTWEAWEKGGEERERLVRYNVQDTALLPKIEAKTGYMELFFTLCDVCRVFPETRGLNPTVQMDGFMLQLGAKRNVRFPTKVYTENYEKSEGFKGAYVMQPKTNGIEKMVHVADFASLYPSIIVSWNMSPDTRRDAPVNGPIPQELCRAAKTGVSFDVTQRGVLPTAVLEMLTLRVYWNDKKASLPPGTEEWKDADRRSTAYKVAVNSFYGVVGNEQSRYFDRKVAESVTQCGVWLIQETIAEAEAKGMRVVYADTDSLFATGATEEEFGNFVKWCNSDLYPQLLKRQGALEENFRIKLAYEKAFERIVFTSAKRYAGKYAHYKGKRAEANSKPEVRGLEYRRGDTSVLARKLQYEVIQKLMGGEENPVVYEKMVESMLAHVLQGDLTLEEVVVSKGLSKPLKEYATKFKKDGSEAAEIIHVQVAKMMQERGMEVREGTRIPYVIVDQGPPMKAIPASDYEKTKEVDRYYMWEVTIYPPTLRLLQAAFPYHVSWSLFEKQRPKGHKDQLNLFGLKP